MRQGVGSSTLAIALRRQFLRVSGGDFALGGVEIGEEEGRIVVRPGDGRRAEEKSFPSHRFANEHVADDAALPESPAVTRIAWYFDRGIFR